MKEIQPLVQSRTPVSGAVGEPRRAAAVPSSARLTNFYPLYSASNDQVDPVQRVQPVQFQRVLPRYELSTSETRDQGLGPMFADIPESPALPILRSPGRGQRVAAAEAAVASGERGAAPAAARMGTRESLREPWLGRRVDVYA
jgi:hypothetical protein